MKRTMLLLFTVWTCITMGAQDSLRIRLDSLLCDPMFETSQPTPYTISAMPASC